MTPPSLLHRRISPPSTPLLYPAVAILLGTFLGLHYQTAGYVGMAVATLLLLTAAALLMLRRFTACVIITCIAAGWINAELHTAASRIPMAYRTGTWVFSGKIDRIKETETATVTDVTIDSIGRHPRSLKSVRPVKIQLTIAGFDHKADIATRISWTGNLSDSHAADRLPMMDDIGKHARRRGIAGAVVIRPDDILSVIDAPGILNSLYRLRADIASSLYDTSLSPNATEFLNVVLLGDTELLSTDRRESYTAAGLSHILALSGMHVAIIALLISAALFPLLMLRWRTGVIIITVAALWFYAAVTGFSPSVTRAVIMASVFSGARLLQRRSSPYNSLCMAAIIIVVANPYALLSYSFQMSFAAVASIVAFAKVLTPVNPRRRLPYYLMSYITLPVSAMAGTGLIACYHFHTFPLYFIPASVVATLLLPVICIGGVIATVLNTLHLHGFLYTSACTVTDFSVNILDHTARLISSLPGALWSSIELSAESLCFSLGAVILLAVCLNMKKRVYGYASLMLAAAAIACTIIRPAYPYRNVSVILVPDRSFTTLLIRKGSNAFISTDACGSDTTLVRQRVERDFESFLRLTDTESLSIDNPSRHSKHSIYLLKVLDKTSMSAPIANSDSSFTYIIITGKAKADDIRKAPWHMLAGNPIKVIPSPALRPKVASIVEERCKEHGITTSRTMVITD